MFGGQFCLVKSFGSWSSLQCICLKSQNCRMVGEFVNAIIPTVCNWPDCIMMRSLLLTFDLLAGKFDGQSLLERLVSYVSLIALHLHQVTQAAAQAQANARIVTDSGSVGTTVCWRLRRSSKGAGPCAA